MAQKVTVTLVDDLDGGTAEETVEFGIDGVSYEIDLSASESRTAWRPAACNGSIRAGSVAVSLAKKRQAACVLAKALVRRGRAAGPAANGGALRRCSFTSWT